MALVSRATNAMRVGVDVKIRRKFDRTRELTTNYVYSSQLFASIVTTASLHRYYECCSSGCSKF